HTRCSRDWSSDVCSSDLFYEGLSRKDELKVRATAEKLENNKVALTIEIEAEKVDAALDRAYRKLARDVTIPGFRKGRAPRKVIRSEERRVGNEHTARGTG